MHIALIEPEIPGNTGSIGRVCVGTDATLHLVGKLGFSLDERYVRRAGLDYWPKVRLQRHADLQALLDALPASTPRFFSAHGKIRYDRVAYGQDDILIFGGESRGLPQEIQQNYEDLLIYLPTTAHIRSLNLANAVTAVLYEALRQQGFPGLIY